MASSPARWSATSWPTVVSAAIIRSAKSVFGESTGRAIIAWDRDLLREPPRALRGFVTFAHFTCQPRFALKACAKENQSFGALDVGARSTKNGRFLASVTMPQRHQDHRLNRDATRRLAGRGRRATSACRAGPSLAVTRRERRLNCSPGLAIIAVASTRPATSVALAFARPTIDNR